MKKHLLLPLFLLLAVASSTLTANGLTLSFDGLATQKIKFSEKALAEQEIAYSYTETSFLYAHGLSEKCNLLLGAGFERTRVAWDENPFFRMKRFDRVDVSIGAQTERWDDWDWTALLGVKIDTEHSNISHYGQWHLTLWGRYNYSDRLGLHVGLLGRTGLKDDDMYPILGLDYQFENDWKLNMVFPIKVSAVYTLSDKWSLFVSARKISSRHRLGPTEPLMKGVFEYKAYGGEAGIQLDCGSRLVAKILVGGVLSGSLKTLNRFGGGITYTDFDSGAYVGGMLSYTY